MRRLRLVTAGESHGPAVVAVLTGLPAGLTLDRAALDAELRRRQGGYGRGGRQQIEHDEVEVLAGLRGGVTLGSPLCLVVRNRDFDRWRATMDPWAPPDDPAPLTRPRPGHADLAGALKLGLHDARPVLERASARSTVARVAAGAVAKALLHEFGVDDGAPCRMDEIADVLLEALEVACLAGGGRRLVLLPRAAIAEHLLRVRGFVQVAEGCAGSWFEKLFPS